MIGSSYLIAVLFPPIWFFTGQIDNAAVWKTNLSDAEVLGVFVDGVEASNSDLVGYWNFNEGEGQMMFDASVNSNDGYLGSSVNADSSDPDWSIE